MKWDRTYIVLMLLIVAALTMTLFNWPRRASGHGTGHGDVTLSCLESDGRGGCKRWK